MKALWASVLLATGTPDDPRVAGWLQTLFWCAVLLLILVVAAGAIVVFSRRFRTYLLPGDRKPTPDADAWSMHRLPSTFEVDQDVDAHRRDGDAGEDHSPFGPDKSPPDEPSIG